jgi:phage/plasmid-like protein (TIGR03299 family)
MSHNIWDRDSLVLFKKPAWHGLGLVVDKAPSPTEALYAAKLDWEVEQVPLTGHRKQHFIDDQNNLVEREVAIDVPSHCAHVRSDTGEVLSVNGADFGIVQNADLVRLIYAAAENEDVKVESAGSLRNGRDVFFLCHLATFGLQGGQDRVHQYALVSNAHDGSRKLRVLPTDVRVVCANTMNWALGSKAGIALRHSSGIMDRVQEVTDALRGVKAQATKAQSDSFAMAERRMTESEVRDFFLGIYQKQYGSVPATVRNKKDAGIHRRAKKRVGEWLTALVDESRALGTPPTAWLAANAVTQWSDHRRTARGDRTYSNLLGSSAAFKDTVFKEALALTA